MENTARDRRFLHGGVCFLPWVGDQYECGFHGRRVLLLGESEYSDWNGARHQRGQTSTREHVEWIFGRRDGANFFRNLEQALVNEHRELGWAPSGGKALWDQIALYNFVQTSVLGGARVRPEATAFRAARKPFRVVLEELRPERVIVCGKHLWASMEPIEDEGYLHDDVQAYFLADRTKIWCLATVHPSSGRYSWKIEHPKIIAFLDQPAKALQMLGPKRW